jgi:ABC-type uncharacterized transport system permease subunit
VLPLCAAAFGFTVAIENANALIFLKIQFLNCMYVLDYWNCTALIVAHGMIMICAHFMHVLSLLPALQKQKRSNSIKIAIRGA